MRGWYGRTTPEFFTATRCAGEISCAHPVQVYLDLKDHPERSAEAAGALRQNVLKAAHA